MEKNQLTLVTKVTDDSKTLQIIQRLQMLVCKHSEGRVNTMQLRQGEDGGGEEGRSVAEGSVNNRQGSAERSRWPCHGDAIENASPKIPRQVGDDTIQRLPSQWGSRQDGSQKNTEQTYTTVYVQV